MEIQAGSHKEDPRQCKPVCTTRLLTILDNGDPSLFTQLRSRLVHTTEIQTGSQTILDNGDPSRFTQGRSKAMQACLHNRTPNDIRQWRSKPVYTMEIQAGSHNGDPSRFPNHVRQWRSKPVHTTEIQAGSHNGDPRQCKPVCTTGRLTILDNGDPSRFTRLRSRLVHTTEIQTGSQTILDNGDPSRFTQRRSKPVSTMCKCSRWVTEDPTQPTSRGVPGHCRKGQQKGVHRAYKRMANGKEERSGTTVFPTHSGSQTMLDNRDPSRFTQRRSKPVHTREIQSNASLYAQHKS